MKIVIAHILLLAVAVAITSAQQPVPRVVDIAAKRFTFTPNEIVLKRGEPVTLRVTSDDFEHGFFQKELGVDRDLTPEHATEVTITPQTAGRYTVICDNFCGSGHGNMKMTVVVE